MPGTINYRPEIFDQLITSDRLSSYQNIFSANNDLELAGAYLWNLQVASVMYPLICSVEISLRNSVNHALTQDLGKFWWKKNKLHFKSFVSPAHSEPFPVKAVKQNFSRATEQVKKDKKNRYQITNAIAKHDEIIAKTEFSTWQYLLDQEFMGNNLIWPKNLGKVFFGSWPHAKASNTLQFAHDSTKIVREFRNRIVHHEPVWKHYGVSSESDAIAYLHDKINLMVVFLNLISSQKKELVVRNNLVKRAFRVCSINEIRRCQHSLDSVRVKSINKLGKTAAHAIDNQEVKKVIVYSPGKKVFYLYPD